MKKYISFLMGLLLCAVLVCGMSTVALAAGAQADRYTITFDVSDGEPVAPIVAPYGAAVSAPAEPTRYGYRFDGWYADAALTTPFTFTTMPRNGATVYAKWVSKDIGRGIEYRVNEITYRDPATYRMLDEIPAKDFLVEATITNLKSVNTDTFLFVTYTAQGQQIGVHYAYANPSIRQSMTIGTCIENSDGRVAEVKLLVLSSLRGFTPLAMTSPARVVSEGFVRVGFKKPQDMGNGLIQVEAFSFDTKQMKTLTLRGTVQDVAKGYVYACDYYPAEGVHELTEAEDAVANEVSKDLVWVTGYITKNQATGEKYTELSTGLRLNIETGLDMLGHRVTAYYAENGEYRSEMNPGTAYCVQDLLDYYTVKDPIYNDKNAYLAVFGKQIQTANSVNAFMADGRTGMFGSYDEDLYIADAGTYGVDPETGKIVCYIAPPAITISQVGFVKNVAGRETIRIGSTIYENNADKDVIVEYEGIAEDDIVAMKSYRWNSATREGMVYVEKIEPVRGKIEAVRTDRLNGFAVRYVTIDGKDYLDGHANISIDGWAGEVLQVTEYRADRLKEYDAYIYDGKLIGAQLVSGAGQLEDAIFVVNTYSVDKSNGYGMVEHYYAQGVNTKGEEVSILIGIQGVNDVADDVYGLGCIAVTSVPPGRFYNFKLSLDREQAKKDIMYGTCAQSYRSGMTEKDGYFAVAGATTITPNKLEKDDFFLLMGAATADNRLLLTEQTKFILVERPTGVDELNVATYTGPISKNLAMTANSDMLFVAAMADADGGNKTAEVVVIMTDKVNVVHEDYIYIAPTATYSQVSNGWQYDAAYFTDANEYKTIVADRKYGQGFYEIEEIDEDGVYWLAAAAFDRTWVNMSAAAVYDNNLIVNTVNEDMFALADDAKIIDTRTEYAIQNSAVAKIETLADICAALNINHEVKVDLLLTDVGPEEYKISHLFISDVINYNAPAVNANITVMYADGGTVSVDKQAAALGQTVTITLEPDEGYEVKDILLNGRVIATGVNRTTFTVTGNHIVSATFVPVQLPKVEDAIFVVNTYAITVSNGYGNVEHYYAQGVNTKGEEVSILIGIDGVNDYTDDHNGLGYAPVRYMTTGMFYNFEKSLDREQAKKDIMYGIPVQAFDADGDGLHRDIDGYFAVANAATITANKLEKEDKYLLMGGSSASVNRLFLTEQTKFILVERPAGIEELNIATYTSPIAKVLNQSATADQIFVAAMGDVTGANKTAEVVVIMTDKLNLMPEGYVYISPDATYSDTADGIKYDGIYFTETEEFKSVTVGERVPYADGFYEIDEKDEDGVYHLIAVSTPLTLRNITAKGVYGNKLIVNTVNEDMFALADDAKIYDVRSEEWLEKSEVSEITSLEDIAAAIKGSDPYTVTFDLLLEEVNATTMEITHIFVKSISKAGYEM